MRAGLHGAMGRNRFCQGPVNGPDSQKEGREEGGAAEQDQLPPGGQRRALLGCAVHRGARPKQLAGIGEEEGRLQGPGSDVGAKDRALRTPAREEGELEGFESVGFLLLFFQG